MIIRTNRTKNTKVFLWPKKLTVQQFFPRERAKYTTQFSPTNIFFCLINKTIIICRNNRYKSHFQFHHKFLSGFVSKPPGPGTLLEKSFSINSKRDYHFFPCALQKKSLNINQPNCFYNVFLKSVSEIILDIQTNLHLL